jgi:hypothetical protein
VVASAEATIPVVHGFGIEDRADEPSVDYRQEFSLEEMSYINLDWFRLLNHYATPEEIAGTCDWADSKIEHLDVQEAGITIVARKF